MKEQRTGEPQRGGSENARPNDYRCPKERLQDEGGLAIC